MILRSQTNELALMHMYVIHNRVFFFFGQHGGMSYYWVSGNFPMDPVGQCHPRHVVLLCRSVKGYNSPPIL